MPVTYHEGLLEQARHLLTRDKKNPRPENLRRAVSSAYYAIFHLLVNDATERLLPGASQEKFRRGLGRVFDHRDMKAASKAVVSGLFKGSFSSLVAPPELKKVAQAFLDLQDARHRADYDLSAPFWKTEATRLIEQAESAFDLWKKVRRNRVAKTYLLLLLAHSRLHG